MSRPPIKAFEAVIKYCKNNASCKKCPVCNLTFEGYLRCAMYTPERWIINKKEGEAE